jgi:hypothetical protein
MSQREHAATAALLGRDETEELTFAWGTTLAVSSCSQILDVVEVRDVDKNELLGYVVFDPAGGVLTAFTPPERR